MGEVDTDFQLEISHGDIIESVVTIVNNCVVYLKVAKRVDLEVLTTGNI